MGPPEGNGGGTWGFDRVLLLVRDPNWLYCWWEVTPAAYGRAQEQLPEGQRSGLVLRLVDVESEQPVSETGVAYGLVAAVTAAAGKYLPVPRPGRLYRAEIGLRWGQQFVRIASSSPVLALTGPELAGDGGESPSPALYRLAGSPAFVASWPEPASSPARTPAAAAQPEREGP